MRAIGVPREWRPLRPPLLPSTSRKKLPFAKISSKTLLRFVPTLIVLALIPPIFFHFRLRHFQRIRWKKCGWLENPPLVCAHGGDSSKAAPNTMEAYRIALDSHVDCIEIDVSRSLDGELFALHDRDLQRMTGNSSTKVGHMRKEEIRELDASFPKSEFGNQKVPTIEDALMFVSGSVRQVILDAKVGPPSYEKRLAKDILSVVKRTKCENCLIWAKSDRLGRDVIKLSPDIPVGYIVMKDPKTGFTSKLLRTRKARVVGVYHPLIDKKLVKILHGKRKKVYAWTVDDIDSMQRMLLERVDAIVTDHPSQLQHLMTDTKVECLEDGFPIP